MCRPSMQCARPSLATSCEASDVMSLPFSVMRPAAVGIMPLMTRAAVVLPAPLVPSRATTSPRWTTRSMSESALKWP